METVFANTSLRVWIYARQPGNYAACQMQQAYLCLRVRREGCQIVGSSMDGGSLFAPRPGYRELLRAVRQHQAEIVYLYDPRAISHWDIARYFFFRKLIRYGVSLRITNGSLSGRAATRAQRFAERKGCAWIR